MIGYQPARRATHNGEVRDQRGQLRPELAVDVVGERRPGRLPTRRTHDRGALIFGDEGVNWGQLGDLMAPGSPVTPRRRAGSACRQRRQASGNTFTIRYADGVGLYSP